MGHNCSLADTIGDDGLTHISDPRAVVRAGDQLLQPGNADPHGQRRETNRSLYCRSGLLFHDSGLANVRAATIPMQAHAKLGAGGLFDTVSRADTPYLCSRRRQRA